MLPEIRPIQASDGPLFLDLAERVTGEPGSLTDWEWKYWQNPHGAPLSAVAESKGKIVGWLGAVPRRFLLDGHPVLGSHEIDVMIDADHRSAATFLRLFRERERINAQQGIDFFFGFGNASATKVAQGLIQTVVVGPIPRYVRPLNFARILRHHGLPGLFASTISWPLTRLMSRVRLSSPPPGLEYVPMHHFDVRFDTFFNAVKGVKPLVPVCDTDYLNWRFLRGPSPPENQIMALQSRADQLLLGYYIVSVRNGPVRRGIIAALKVLPSHPELKPVLLQRAIRHLVDLKSDTIAIWMGPEPALQTTLREHHFRHRPVPGQALVSRPTLLNQPHPLQRYLTDQCHWDISAGDSDHC